MSSIGPGTCADCGTPYPHLQKAHIVARHKGGADDPSNIIHICPNCHHIRDRADRVAWLQARWAKVPREQRSKSMSAQMASTPLEAQRTRAQKISASKTGKKHPPGHRTGGARALTPEQLEKRAASVRATYAKWTPEQRAAHAAKVSAGKRETRP